MSDSTPAPWHVAPTVTGRSWIWDKHGERVGKATPRKKRGEREGNERLMAAAPEMLKALCSISLMEHESTSSSVEKVRAAVRIARSAIAKARGETT